MLKNEIQLPYLTNAEQIAQSMKKAITKYPLDEDPENVSDEN